MNSVPVPEQQLSIDVFVEITPPTEAHLSEWESRHHEIPGYKIDGESASLSSLPPAYTRSVHPPSYDQSIQSPSKTESHRLPRPWLKKTALALVTGDLFITITVYITSLTDLCRIGLFAFGSWVPLVFIFSDIFGRIGFVHVRIPVRVSLTLLTLNCNDRTNQIGF